MLYTRISFWNGGIEIEPSYEEQILPEVGEVKKELRTKPHLMHDLNLWHRLPRGMNKLHVRTPTRAHTSYMPRILNADASNVNCTTGTYASKYRHS